MRTLHLGGGVQLLPVQVQTVLIYSLYSGFTYDTDYSVYCGLTVSCLDSAFAPTPPLSIVLIVQLGLGVKTRAEKSEPISTQVYDDG